MKTFRSLTWMVLLLTCSVYGQVTFIIDSLPPYTPPEDILYIAGDFQGWNPGDPDWALAQNGDGKWFIEMEGAAGTAIQYKFTRGDWGKVEKGEFGEEIPNRTFTFGSADTVHHIIFNWADISGGQSTAAENVHVMDEEFYMPQLDRHRRIWVYLPPDYEDTGDHYPVIYMHDGQNLFDLYTSFAGEWEVDETLNGLHDEGYRVPIVVGIDNGGSFRIDEYTPWVNPQHGGGQGPLYVDFLVETLKPHIDGNYRTLPGREQTAIWGSSLGGLISEYALMARQEVFGKAGIYSPSYWWSDSVWTFTQQAGMQDDLMIWQMTGSEEGGTMVDDTWAMHDLFESMGLGGEELSTRIVAGGQHNEALWRVDFGEAYLWLFSSFANSVGDMPVRPLALYPNPASDRVRMPLALAGGERVMLITAAGQLAMDVPAPRDGELSLAGVPPGFYMLRVVTDGAIYQGKFMKL